MTLRDLRLRVRALIAPRRVERELDEELAFHLEREAHEQQRAGLTPSAAAARARARFGSIALAADACRDARGTVFVDALVRDVRDALRSFRRAPWVTLTIVATIALGLALVTVAFTVYNALFLRADAVQHPEQLFTVERLVRPDLPHPPGGDRAWMPFSRREYELLRHGSDVLTDALGMLPDVVARIDGRVTNTTLVSGNFFQVLGARAELGRPLIPADDEPATSQQVVVLSHAGWRKFFNGDPTVVGRSIRLNGLPFAVVGVMPETFRGLSVVPPDLWVPLLSVRQFHLPTYLDEYEGKPLDESVVEVVVGRLKPGVSPEKAEAALTAWASGRSDIKRNRPGHPNQLTLTPNRGTLWPLSFRGVIAPAFFAFGLVLMTGCANVANLLLARGLSHRAEIGIRLSLGASRWRVIRQLLVGHLVLALAAAICGVVLSRGLLAGAIRVASTVMSPESAELMRIAPLPVDWRVLLFVAAIAMVSTVLFGLAPALRTTQVDPARAMRGDAMQGARSGRASQVLIALQVGAAGLLLITSGAFLRSAFAAANAPAGVRTSDTLVVPVTHEPFRPAILGALTTDPLVEAVSASWSSGVTGFPAYGGQAVITRPASSATQDRSARDQTTDKVSYAFVSPGYFNVLGIDIVSGRGFAPDERTMDAGVAVVSEAAVRRLWPTGKAVGSVVQFEAQPPPDTQQAASPRAPSRPYVVIGVARDIESTLADALRRFADPNVYLPIGLQNPGTSLVLRVRSDPDEARRALLDRLVAIDPAFGDITTVRAMVNGRAVALWMIFGVTVVLAGLALLLAASGLFSVLSYAIEQRKREIGIRMALGATTRDIAGWVMSRTFISVAVGIVAGAGLATAFVKVLAKWVPFWLGNIATIVEPVAYAAPVILIVVTCTVAVSLPAWRAARVDPVTTLRQD
jgi:predicted permease